MKRYKIMVIDDEPDLLAAMARSLKAAGFDVIRAVNGSSALLELENEHPDLILSDVMMPGLNGFQTTRKIKANEASADIPVILMSAKTEPADQFWASEVGALALLQKPLDTRALIERIQLVLTQS